MWGDDDFWVRKFVECKSEEKRDRRRAIKELNERSKRTLQITPIQRPIRYLKPKRWESTLQLTQDFVLKSLSIADYCVTVLGFMQTIIGFLWSPRILLLQILLEFDSLRTMTTQNLQDKLLFFTEKRQSTLPPECALIVLTSTLSTPLTFLHQHFLNELLKRKEGPDEGVVFLSFLTGLDKVAPGVKRLVYWLFSKLTKGTDLVQAQNQGKFIFLNGFSRLFLPTPKSQLGDYKTVTLSMQKPWIDQIIQSILKALAEIKGRPALIIEGLDFLLAAGPDNITAPQLLTLVSLLSEVSSSTTILI